jgi:outer membrane protein TolC
VTQGIVERRQQNLDLVELRYKVGREHKGALMTAQANAAEADFEFQQAQRNVDLCQRRLSKILGREKFRPIRASGDLKVAGVDPLRPDFEELVGATPLLKELVAKKESAKSGLKSAKADLFPQIYLDGATSRTGQNWTPDTRKWSAGFSVSLPEVASRCRSSPRLERNALCSTTPRNNWKAKS